MKREGFWRDVTPPLNIYGVPPAVYHDLPAVVSVSVKKRHSGCAAAFCCFFMLLGYSGWTVRTLCIRLYSLLQGKQASGRPRWYRHRTELPREWHGPE